MPLNPLAPLPLDLASPSAAHSCLVAAMAAMTNDQAKPPDPASQEVHDETVRAAEAAARDADARAKVQHGTAGTFFSTEV